MSQGRGDKRRHWKPCSLSPIFSDLENADGQFHRSGAFGPRATLNWRTATMAAARGQMHEGFAWQRVENGNRRAIRCEDAASKARDSGPFWRKSGTKTPLLEFPSRLPSQQPRLALGRVLSVVG